MHLISASWIWFKSHFHHFRAQYLSKLISYAFITITHWFWSFIFFQETPAFAACIFSIVKSKARLAWLLWESNQYTIPLFVHFLLPVFIMSPFLFNASNYSFNEKSSFSQQHSDWAIQWKYFLRLKFSKSPSSYIGWYKLLCLFAFIKFEKSKRWDIFQRHVLLDNLIIIRIVEHPIRNAICVHKFCGLLLAQE